MCGRSIGAVVEPRRANLRAPVFTGHGRNSRPVRHRDGRLPGSSGGKRQLEPHGHKSFRPGFPTSSVPVPAMRLPRLTRDSLEGTPAALADGLKRMLRRRGRGTWSSSLAAASRRILASTARLPRVAFCRARRRPPARSQRLLRDLGAGSGPARLGLGAWRDAPTLRLPAVVIGVALSWPASRRAPCGERLERGLPSSK
jgi:hypothetical protein